MTCDSGSNRRAARLTLGGSGFVRVSNGARRRYSVSKEAR